VIQHLRSNRLNWRGNVRRSILVILIGCITAAGVPASQTSPDSSREKRTVAARAKSHITVDGILDEADWSEAPSIGEILQREPHPGEKPTERSEVKILFDGAHFYIGVMCYDSEPSRIIGTQMARDADLSPDDRIEVLIDSFRDRHNAFYFATNPLGALVDGLLIENSELNFDWNAIWTVRTRKSNNGWSAEFAIPFKSLGFKKGQESWGFNFSRTIKRKIEEDRWASPRLARASSAPTGAGSPTLSAELARLWPRATCSQP